jgi:hypothetical protein
MRTTTAVIVGAGQAGLVMSRCLTERAIDHVLLERGEVANAWRGRRDSLRLLTPNWQSRLPGYRYRGDDPDGYMTVPEVIDYLCGYADAIDAPVEAQGAVTSLKADYDGYMITTTNGRWRARTVVVTLQDEGVQLAGRLAGVTDAGIAQFSGSLPNQCSLADLKLRRLLNVIDSWATDHGLHHEIPEPWRASPTVVEESPPLTLDLTVGRIKTIIWAIGCHPDYSWLHIPVLDPKGQIRHQGGVTDMPGLYVIGTKFLRRRTSTFIDGVGDDARDLSNHLAQHLGASASIDPSTNVDNGRGGRGDTASLLTSSHEGV